MEIEEGNLQLDQIFLRMPCSLSWIDRNHKYLGCNIETCIALKANTPEKIIGKTILEIAKKHKLSKSEAKTIYDSNEHLMRSGLSEFQIWKMIPIPAREQYTRHIGAKRPIFNQKKEVIGLMEATVFGYDLGKKFKIGPEPLKQEWVDLFRAKTDTNLSFHEALQLMPCGLFWMNLERFYLGCNLETCKHLQISSPNEIVGKHVHEIPFVKRWLDSKLNRFSRIDEFIMETGIPIFSLESLLPQKERKAPIRQLVSRRAIINGYSSIGLMGAAMSCGPLGIVEQAIIGDI